jgi:hypothetical protein
LTQQPAPGAWVFIGVDDFVNSRLFHFPDSIQPMNSGAPLPGADARLNLSRHLYPFTWMRKGFKASNGSGQLIESKMRPIELKRVKFK